ncbi:MAG: acyltransferase [Bacteroidaceae bacterium]|nr:acyltransferase [Bacteroidaceae bacterium]
MKGTTQKLNWLSIVRGITILLVVMYHTRLQDFNTQQNYAFIDRINAPFATLVMPAFVFYSGALLYYTRLAKGWKVGRLYLDKLVRIGCPLIFCTLVGCASQLVFNSFVKHPHSVTPLTFLLSLVSYEDLPWPHRWYLMQLLVLMALYPLYRLVLRRTWSILVFGIMAILLYMFDFTTFTSRNWFCIFTLNRYLPFFFAGILLFHFQLWKYLRQAKVAIPIAVVYAVMCFVSYEQEWVGLIHHFAGIGTLLALGLWFDRRIPALCHSWRDYVFPIYLFGIAFQAFVELILWPRLGSPELVVPFYLLNIVLGLYIPVLISLVVKRIPSIWIRRCFGL